MSEMATGTKDRWDKLDIFAKAVLIPLIAGAFTYLWHSNDQTRLAIQQQEQTAQARRDEELRDQQRKLDELHREADQAVVLAQYYFDKDERRQQFAIRLADVLNQDHLLTSEMLAIFERNSLDHEGPATTEV